MRMLKTMTLLAVIALIAALMVAFSADDDPKEPVAIMHTSMPDKTTYRVGETFDPSGMEVSLEYSDGETETVPLPSCSFSPEVFTEAGTIKVEVSYDGLSQYVEVSVSGMKMVSLPDKTTYRVGETFDPSGMEVSVVFSDGSEKPLDPGSVDIAYEITPAETAIVVRHDGMKTSFAINIEGPEMPAGVCWDPVSSRLTSDPDALWHVYDMYHAKHLSYNKRYEGYQEQGASIRLDTGMYRVDVRGGSFELEIPGQMEKHAKWKYNLDGQVHDVSVSFSFDFGSFREACDSNKEHNVQMDRTGYRFSYMPGMVVVDDTVRDIVDAMTAEFVRIGGSPDDRQAYAEFLASFAQNAIRYPSSVEEDSYTDSFIWDVYEYWCVPIETLYHMTGDCEDKAALLCAMYTAAGYDSAMAGQQGHIFTGIHLDTFEEATGERLEELGADSYKLCVSEGVTGMDPDNEPVYSDTSYYGVETIRNQKPIGYVSGGSEFLNKPTSPWGWAGFYPVSGG